MTYEEFKSLAGKLTKINLFSYKSQQMDRRIHSLMNSWGLESYEDFYYVLKTDPARYGIFVKRLTINVSEFFRNPERFLELQQKIIPMLKKNNFRLRFWSAGCSNGAEPYSLAMIIYEHHYIHPHYILATDVDDEMLERAREGWFTPSEVKNLTPEQLKKYFYQKGELYYIKDEIKRMVSLKKHNLLADPFEKDFDAIFCRNVVIYLTEEAKDELYRKFYEVLRPGGILMVGCTEPILNCRKFGFEHILTSFYQKTGSKCPGERVGYETSHRRRDARH